MTIATLSAFSLEITHLTAHGPTHAHWVLQHPRHISARLPTPCFPVRARGAGCVHWVSQSVRYFRITYTPFLHSLSEEEKVRFTHLPPLFRRGRSQSTLPRDVYHLISAVNHLHCTVPIRPFPEVTEMRAVT